MIATSSLPITGEVFSYRFSVAERAGFSDFAASLVAESTDVSVYLCCKSLELARKRYPDDPVAAEEAALWLAGVLEDRILEGET